MAVRIDKAVVGELYGRSEAARWQVPADRFADALEESAAKAFADRTPTSRDLNSYLRSLRLDDLALACGCAEGNEAAWEHFVLEYRPLLYRAADALDPSGGARELADALYADLFGLGEDGGERRALFRYFHGRSSLATWLRAVLAQRQVDRVRERARTAPLPDEEPPAPILDPPDPERDRYVTLIHVAFRNAVTRLDPRDRLRLRYYYAQQLTLAETGRLLGEHEASVSRHLASARKAIRRDLERQLHEAGLGPDQIAQCFESVTEDAGPLNLDSLLGEAAGARNLERTVQSGKPSRLEERAWKGGSAR